MHLWVDTIQLSTVQEAVKLGLLYGVTTNPSLIATSNRSMAQLLQELLDHQDGPLAVQVVAEDVQGMVEQGKILYDFSDRIIVKVPVTKNGLEAIRTLSKCQIPTMATVVFHPYQALFAAQAGANYIAPYLSKIEQRGEDGMTVLAAMLQMLYHAESEAEVLAASVHSIQQFEACGEIGIPHITIKEPLLRQLLSDAPSTEEHVAKFSQDWKQAGFSFLEEERV